MTSPRGPAPPGGDTPSAAPVEDAETGADAAAEKASGADSVTGVQDSPARETLALVDRLEGAWAVLIPDVPAPAPPGASARGAAAGREEAAAPFDLPRSLLPPGTREGDAVWLRLSLDAPHRREAEARTERLLAHLTADDDGGDLTL